jgi:hypothetical protein
VSGTRPSTPGQRDGGWRRGWRGGGEGRAYRAGRGRHWSESEVGGGKETCARGRGEREGFGGRGQLTGGAYKEVAAAVLTAARTARTAHVGAGGQAGPPRWLGRAGGERGRPRQAEAGWAAAGSQPKGGERISLFHFPI